MFGNRFFWGSATSAYQVEGGNIWSDWYEWEKMVDLESCGRAVDHYNLFRQDFALAYKLNQNAHRLSLEWARLEPSPGFFNQEAIDHYHQVFSELRRLKIKIFLTLNHFTLPAWLARQGGWENYKILDFFGRYLQLVIKEYGQYIDCWLTINEPMILATEAYLFGHWPPQVKSSPRFMKVLQNMAKVHNFIYDYIHKHYPIAQVGLPHNYFSFVPLRSNSFLDQKAVKRADDFWNRLVLNLTQDKHDFLAVNYYFHQRVSFGFNWRRDWIKFADPKKLHKEVSALGWEVYPEGLEQILLNLNQEYKLPIYVTENGLAAQNDEQQKRFIINSTQAVKRARLAGVQVLGYFYWSLLDNFEWDKGFKPKFGLVEVNRNTMERYLRPAAKEYAAICQERI